MAKAVTAKSSVEDVQTLSHVRRPHHGRAPARDHAPRRTHQETPAEAFHGPGRARPQDRPLASFLSQIETGRVVPTLRNLARISLVFEKDLSHFFGSSDQRIFRVQRQKDRVRLPFGSPKPDYVAESFGILIPEGGLRPCMAEFLPGEERGAFQPKQYPGIEMVYVLNGCVEVGRRGETHELHPRDVLYVSGETKRSYRCLGKQPAQALIISFDSDSGEIRRASRRRIAPATAA